MILISSIIALHLLIWFRTDAYLEYCRLLKLNFISDYKGFDREYSQDVSLTYHIFLRRYHNNFFIRLITCPICLAVWLAIIYTIIFSTFNILPYIILLGIFIYAIIDRLLG